MANGVDVEIEGIEELQKRLRRLGDEIDSDAVLLSALKPGAEIVQRAIKARAPRRTGQLGGSIEISEGEREKVSLRVGPSRSGFYGRYLEYGTRKMSARPFMRPAFDGVRLEAQRAISDALWREVEKRS